MQTRKADGSEPGEKPTRDEPIRPGFEMRGSDEQRRSPELTCNMEKGEYPTRPFLRTTYDCLMNRDAQYDDGDFLPDGIVRPSLTSQPRIASREVAHEDNRETLRHNDSAHPGFAAVQSKIEGEGYSPQEAGAILASRTRNASPAAKKANGNLRRVK